MSARRRVAELEAEVARHQASAGAWLPVLMDCEDTLHHIVAEAEPHTFGKPRYGMTLDDIHDCAMASLVDVRRALAAGQEGVDSE